MKTFKDLTDEHEIYRWRDNGTMSHRILWYGSLAAYESQETSFLNSTGLWGSRLRIPLAIASGQVTL